MRAANTQDTGVESIPAGGILMLVVKKITVTLDQKTVAQLDRWVREGRYSNRSRAVQFALDSLIERQKPQPTHEEPGKLDPAEEKLMAEEGFGDRSWPEY